MSSTIDTHAHYLKSHEWARLDAATGEIVCGISDHAQQSLSDLVYVELPRVGDHKAAGDVFGVVESVKAASDVYMPISGTIAAVNSDLEGAPEMINKDAFGDGWLIRVKPDNVKDLDKLLDAKAYGEFLETEEGH
ncbi:MAG TPA: glycine cleavage system protein GcvH [Thermoflexales bacterium]|nr:glycine cleavage system protein GcvH [Thermoflexales bacterium]HQW35038.1 glycine cleavage system protein GcvH [Thermoflexales bacterium]HQX75169.1 glycine cleavage system protein GcvH [Thermoflexales bacterium]HQZ22036.1 glycine cleavage system protein GcvH [Thermoflexales bacterium]HQZ99786.1 glycine cleavage system protein GcvH [Thermoflexales bacterium]